MDLKTKILLGLFFVILILSISSTYYRIYISNDYLMSIEVPCDPMAENCYMYEDEDSGEEVTYKIIERPAHSLPLCDPSEEDCTDLLFCQEGETDCTITYCDPNSEECAS